MFNHSSQGFLWLESLTNLEKKPDPSGRNYRLDRMKALLEAAGHPEKKFKSVHIAGSKGKGSTAAFTASLLSESGFKTGLYMSPHVSEYKERISLNGHFFREEIYLNELNRLEEIVAKLDTDFPGIGGPTTFELLTLLSFNIFARENCDYAVIETGLGGRLDATNLLRPELSIITAIELEHTNILGDSLAKIAFEKGGIIKPGIPVLIAPQKEEVSDVLKEIASQKKAHIHSPVELLEPVVFVKENEYWISLKINELPLSAKLGIKGNVSAINATLAVYALIMLNPEVEDHQLVLGLEKASIPARTEIFNYKATKIILDGAHTPASIKNMVSTFNDLSPLGGVLLFGCVEDKDAEGMAILCKNTFDHIIISTPGYFKKTDIDKVFSVFSRIMNPCQKVSRPEEALEKAVSLCRKNQTILVTGSFYMCGEIRKILLKNLPSQTE